MKDKDPKAATCPRVGYEGSGIARGQRKNGASKMTLRVAVLVLASVAPALAEDWIAFPMGEGPDLNVDRLSIRRDTDGTIVPWGKGWMIAKTMTKEGSYKSAGYFVTDCQKLYYIFRANPQSGAVEDKGAQPRQVGDGTVAQRIQGVVCGGAK
jgi:hypothetical protein